MNPIIKPCLFRGWAIDLIGQILPPSSKGHNFILVAVDYFTKWVEAIPLKKVTLANMNDFVKEHIVYQFGIPHTITKIRVLCLHKVSLMNLQSVWGSRC